MIRVARQTEGTDIRKRRPQRRKVEQKQVQIQEEAANRVNNRNTLSVEERVRGSLFGFKKFQKFFRMIDGNRGLCKIAGVACDDTIHFISECCFYHYGVFKI